MTSTTLDALIRAALAEDIGAGDFTTEWTVSEDGRATAVVVVKQVATVAGIEPFRHVFTCVDPTVEVEVLCPDGAEVDNETEVIRLTGPTRSLLTGERVALNFLGRLSGIATLTRAFTRAVEGTGTRIIDTRKTTPGWRGLEKKAVKAGGGTNHRYGLYDMVLIKDNHIVGSGGIGEAVEAVRRRNTRGLQVEVEITNMNELEIALSAGVDRILLDNMSPEEVALCVTRIRQHTPGTPESEASGNMSLSTVRAYAETGVDFLSVGALTHSAPNADFSMRLRH